GRVCRLLLPGGTIYKSGNFDRIQTVPYAVAWSWSHTASRARSTHAKQDRHRERGLESFRTFAGWCSPARTSGTGPTERQALHQTAVQTSHCSGPQPNDYDDQDLGKKHYDFERTVDANTGVGCLGTNPDSQWSNRTRQFRRNLIDASAGERADDGHRD